MKANFMKYFMMIAMLMLLGSGFALAGGRNHYSQLPSYSHNGVHQHNRHSWGHQRHWPRNHYHHYYHHGPQYYHYHSYGRPAYYSYYNACYPRYWDRYDGAYYLSGAFSEPGFGFAFGTYGNW
jgi:hypothetical protein